MTTEAYLSWEVDGLVMSGWGKGQYFSYNIEITTFLVVSEAGNARSTRAIAFLIAWEVETFEAFRNFCLILYHLSLLSFTITLYFFLFFLLCHVLSSISQSFIIPSTIFSIPFTIFLLGNFVCVKHV